ncbi:hypothetical protein M5K25_001608 [Dendrobium thyrsiflorum]|uniref:Transmembrane protein n=1 Tax=Dendrobium thyrsiflorum TaxID=117978 RepID=A0ABD0W0B2_DENTH
MASHFFLHQSPYLNPATGITKDTDRKVEEMTSQEEENGEGNFISSLVKQSFHRISLTLLSLLLPLSLLLLSRLTSSPPTCKIISVILYILVFVLSFTCLVFSITGHSLTMKAPRSIAWVILILFQGCISWAIKVTTTTTFEPIGGDDDNIILVIWIKRTFIFVGVYEIMVRWRRVIVKPVVDDTVYGEERKEKGVEKTMMGIAFIVLWLWMLRMKVEPLDFVAGNGSLGKGVQWSGFALWLLGLAVLMTGSLRVVGVLVWSIMAALVKIMQWREQLDEDCIDDKV